MPGGISTPQERGYFAPGQVIQDAVGQYVQLQIRQAQEARAQQEAEQAMQIRAAEEQRTGKRFGTEQGVREASAAPQIDPDVIRQKVLAAQLAGGNEVGNQMFYSRMPALPRLAMQAGHLPVANDSLATFDPTTGSPVTTTQNRLQDPASGLYTPFGGGRVQGAPPVSTETTIKQPEPGAAATPGLAVVREVDTARGPNGEKLVTRTTEKPQRITPPHGDAALLDMAERLGVDPDDLADAVQGMINKRSAIAPNDLNKPKADTVESLNAKLSELQAALKDETDPAQLANIRQAIQNTQGRIDAKNRQFTPKPAKPSFREQLGLNAPNPNGTPGNAAAPSGAGKSAAPTQPVAGTPIGTPVPPAVPKTTPAGPAQPATTNPPAVDSGKYTKGTIYRDAQGNRALWNGTQFVDVPAGK